MPDIQKAWEPTKKLPGLFMHVMLISPYIYRVAPMLSYINGKLLLYTEFEITTAAYGKTDSYYDVHDALPVTNTRISFSAGYFF